MEYQLLFPTFIAIMAGFDLVARAAKTLGGDSPSSPAPGRRGDWYVFFHCRDLTGEPESRGGKEPRPRADQRREGRNSRPVLHAQ